MKPRVLFILKYRENAWGDPTYGDGKKKGLSSGLLNSATFVKDMLLASGVDAELVQVPDNNHIDREVTRYRPTHAVVEALWVVPDKFDILTKLHPKVKWVIRNHSELPFLSNEGIAMQWLLEYVSRPNVSISNNAPRAQSEMEFLVSQAHPGWTTGQVWNKVAYLPNYYPVPEPTSRSPSTGDEINVGCFGAIRPLKNHLTQAVAAMQYAHSAGKRLAFHVNGTRIEGKGEPIHRNLVQLFAHTPRHRLVEHKWMDHDRFIEVCRGMDLGLQCSFSETFNIVAADLVSCGMPVVGSSEIPWLNKQYAADPTSSASIVDAIGRAMHFHDLAPGRDLNREGLASYVETSRAIWLDYLGT